MEMEHVPVERLIIAATMDEMVFTQEEFDHVENCCACFGTWVRFIKDVLLIPPRSRKNPSSKSVEMGARRTND